MRIFVTRVSHNLLYFGARETGGVHNGRKARQQQPILPGSMSRQLFSAKLTWHLLEAPYGEIALLMLGAISGASQKRQQVYDTGSRACRDDGHHMLKIDGPIHKSTEGDLMIPFQCSISNLRPIRSSSTSHDAESNLPYVSPGSSYLRELFRPSTTKSASPTDDEPPPRPPPPRPEPKPYTTRTITKGRSEHIVGYNMSLLASSPC